MKNTVFLLLFALASICGYSQQKKKQLYPYLTYTPAGYNSNNSYPLIIYLHGSSQRGSDLSQLKGYGLPYIIDKGKQFEAIVISPQCPSGKQWPDENWFEPLFAELKTKFKIDLNRVYITGVSMGGYGTYGVLTDFPDAFAAALPLCGWSNSSIIDKICAISHIPIRTLHGTADNIIPITETDRIATAIQKCKQNKFMFTRLQGEGHQIHYLYDENPELIDWLLQQKKR